MSIDIYLNNQILSLISISLYSLWFVFFILNKSPSVNRSVPTQVALIKNTLPEGLYNEFLMARFSIITLGYVSMHLLLGRSYSGLVLFNQLSITSLSYNIIFVVVSIYVVLMWLVYTLLFHSRGLNADYIFALANTCLIAPLMYLSANLFSFFFILEVSSVLIFLKFTTIQVCKAPTKGARQQGGTGAVQVVPESQLTTLFTQYWVSFFSSILLVFFIMLSLFLCNTTNYSDLDAILLPSLSGQGSLSTPMLIVWDFFFLLGFFLKSGIAPVHNFKIEIYKGIPLVSALSYTFIYFLNFLLYFIFLLIFGLPHIKEFSGTLLQLFLLVSFVYLLSSLFVNKYTKSFLALSSILNSLLFVVVALSTTY